jgi:PAS domain S-box-containing protein
MTKPSKNATKKALKQNAKKYSNIIANMNMGLLEVDNEDTILFANQSFCDMSGYSLLDLLGNKAHPNLLDKQEQKCGPIKKCGSHNGTSDSYEIKAQK